VYEYTFSVNLFTDFVYYPYNLPGVRERGVTTIIEDKVYQMLLFILTAKEV
jgi:hypothetical protein